MSGSGEGLSPTRIYLPPLPCQGVREADHVDVISALLAGMSTAKEVPFVQTAEDPWRLGFFLMAVNIGNLVDIGEFKTKGRRPGTKLQVVEAR